MDMLLDAPAKLNLSLDITGGDGMGYHLLDGVMLRIDRADRVRLTLLGGGGIRVSCTGPFAEGVPRDERNLAAKAGFRFFAETGESRGLLIELEKHIPSRAGLGGGSADAAAVLRGVNELLGARLPDGELERMGLGLGADVPFCLRGGCARARGRGERLDPLPVPAGCVFVVAKPAAGMSTRQAFALYDTRESEPRRPDIPAMLAAIGQGDLPAVGRAMGNVFEGLGAPPAVARIKEVMRASGALGAAMTGSGTAVAGLFADEAAASACAGRLREFPAVFLARPMP